MDRWDGATAARKAHADFVSKWKSRCPGVVKSLSARFCSRKKSGRRLVQLNP